MFDGSHRARRVAFVYIIDPEDRSLERVRYIKITARVKSERVRRWSIISKKDCVLAAVGITDVSFEWRSYVRNRRNVLNGRRGVFEIGGYTLNLRCLSYK